MLRRCAANGVAPAARCRARHDGVYTTRHDALLLTERRLYECARADL